MRAVAIKTDAQGSAGGFVLPGSHVDVYHAGRYGDRMESRLVLQNILVRAIDLQPVRPDDRPGIVPATVTLEVTPEQALILVTVKDSGAITLALRSVGDTAEVSDPTPKRPVPPPQPPPAKVAVVKKPEDIHRESLTIYNGTHWTRTTFVRKGDEVRTEQESSVGDEPAPALLPVPQPVAVPNKAAKPAPAPAGGAK